LQIPLSVDPDASETLQSQIVAQIRWLIREKRLAQGAAVPTSRELGQQLGVSRNTILSAYDILVSEGYLQTRPAVGTFVCDTLPEDMLNVPTRGSESRSGSLERALNLALPYTGRGVTSLHRPTPTDVDVDFVFGRSAPRAFPEKAWRKTIGDCLGGAATRMSEYNDPAGNPELRQIITSLLGRGEAWSCR
jgi:GntR family transcriptional regulator/MocR family aminotransferase